MLNRLVAVVVSLVVDFFLIIRVVVDLMFKAIAAEVEAMVELVSSGLVLGLVIRRLIVTVRRPRLARSVARRT